MPPNKMKRLVTRTDPVTGGSWLARVPAPRWYFGESEDYAPQRKPNKIQRAKLRRRNRCADSLVPEPTPRMALDDPERWELKQEVLKAAGYRCQKCKSRQRLTVDHIVARVLGGGNHRGNLQCLCECCNKAKGLAIWAPDQRRAA